MNPYPGRGTPYPSKATRGQRNIKRGEGWGPENLKRASQTSNPLGKP